MVAATSQAEEDILKSYITHANCYVTKLVDGEGLCRLRNP
jgi:hypothetical protein